MHIADEDPELTACGYILSRTGLLPTDPRFQDLVENPLLMAFTYHWLQKREETQIQVLWKALGVHWTWEDVQDAPNTGPQYEMFVPLSIALHPDSKEFRKWLRQNLKPRPKSLGKPRPGVIELGELPKEEWQRWTQAALVGAGVPINFGPQEPKPEEQKDQDKS